MVFCNLRKGSDFDGKCGGHNPYFNRWFSAIGNKTHGYVSMCESQSLF